MQSLLYRFTAALIIVMGVSSFVHALILDNFFPGNAINSLGLAYVVNGVLAMVIFSVIYIFRKKLYSQIGFLFLAGSLLKFLVFFLVFLPIYNADGTLSRMEFITFFIPYAFALIIETISVSRLLK
ncbi:hypothetical protein [Galbibacter sp. PAP.153]|uniref:hypothetical protein n=1 Tax=Galbibacter sp. PAP.153 TaxID=3104623 RepID=UPI003009E56C